ncbi:uncharacterized protein METZ01_LOCUS419112, partial [marine metagenome]
MIKFTLNLKNKKLIGNDCGQTRK